MRLQGKIELLTHYATCKPLSTEYSWNFKVIDKCPPTFLNQSLKELCEGPDHLTLAPVYNQNIAIFQNQYCVMCHGLPLSQVKPISLSFTCKRNYIDKIDEQIKIGNLTAFKRLLFDSCTYTAEVLKNQFHHGTPGLKYEWIARQSCVMRGSTCNGCESLCTSFIMPVRESMVNPFYNGCGLDVLNTHCSRIYQGSRDTPQFPSYSLLFSISSGQSSIKIRKFHSETKKDYDTYCGVQEKLDFFNDTCGRFDPNVLLDNRQLYLPDQSNIAEMYRVIVIDSISHQEVLRNLSYRHFNARNRSMCFQGTMNNPIMNKLWRNTAELENKACIIFPQLFEEFKDAYEFAETVFSKAKISTEILISNVILPFRNINCDSNELFATKANIFNHSGDYMLVADFDMERYMTLLNESVIVAKVQRNSEMKKSKGSVIAFFCRKRMYDTTKYLGIITVVCNSISLTFLFATTSLYVMMKSLRSKVLSAIPHLAISLFWAQLLFQVSYILVNGQQAMHLHG